MKPTELESSCPIQLIFIMSVTPLREPTTSGSGSPRYGDPDAPLDQSFFSPLASTRTCIPPGSPTFFPFVVVRVNYDPAALNPVVSSDDAPPSSDS